MATPALAPRTVAVSAAWPWERTGLVSAGLASGTIAGRAVIAFGNEPGAVTTAMFGPPAPGRSDPWRQAGRREAGSVHCDSPPGSGTVPYLSEKLPLRQIRSRTNLV